MFAVLDENANSMISKEEFAAVTAVLRRRLRRISHVQRTGLDTSSGRWLSCTDAVPLCEMMRVPHHCFRALIDLSWSCL